MGTVLVNPLAEPPRPHRQPAPRLDALAGKSIGLIDISKPGGEAYLDQIEENLKTHYGVQKTVRLKKPTFTKRAPDAIIEQLVAECDGVIEALAD